jgi:MFS family permease
MRRWGIVMAIGLAIFLSAVDINSVALALPVMGKTFQQSDEAMSWVMLSYLLPQTLLMVPCGLVVTRWPPLLTQMLGVAGFGLASLLCAFAPTFGLLLVARAIQGSFGTLVTTQGVALIAIAVKPQERGKAMGIIASMAPFGAIAGPGLGGFLLATWGWRSIFLINEPIILVALVLTLWCFPGLTFGQSRTSGLGQMGQLLRQPRFLGTLLILLVYGSVNGALAYLLPFTLQDVHHLNLTLAGATLLVPSLATAVISPLSGILSDRFGVRRVLPTGWIMTLIGLLTLSLAIATPTSVLNLDWRLLLIGLGNGIAYGPLLTLMMSIGPRETLGAASALSGVTRQIGFICGPTLVSLVWSWQIAARAAERASSSILLLIAFSVVGLIGALFSVRGWSQSSLQASAPTEATPEEGRAVPTTQGVGKTG